ncbi:phosphoesterase [Brachyspira hampsonii]|uniref:Phosphoesterase n=1 Tax=Brachyspira hampsonii TaxID=1287055 RepID=A0A1E5NJ15_9SPIR|nr:metallophosphoesterase [Brachyspira hampsonii]OEJ16114.1 phosphoesterase [Brachyspira hampsonii]
MRFAVIGDLHGKNCWKKLIEGRFDNFDKIIFMGDYSDDSWVTFTDEEIVNNLKDVIEFKKNHNDKIVLLIGNHDFQYIVGYPTASRYRKSYAEEMHEIFNNNSDIFSPIHIENNYIFTHAGITNGWIEYIRHKYDIKDINIDNVYDIVSLVYKNDKNDCNIASFRRGGGSEFAGILWADTGDLYDDAWTGYNQVVGHNRVKAGSVIKKDNYAVYMSDHFDTEQDKLLVLDI